MVIDKQEQCAIQDDKIDGTLLVGVAIQRHQASDKAECDLDGTLLLLVNYLSVGWDDFTTPIIG